MTVLNLSVTLLVEFCRPTPLQTGRRISTLARSVAATAYRVHRSILLLFIANMCRDALHAQPAQFDAEEIKVNDQIWSYYRTGNGEPLLLLHGFGASKDSWSFIIPYLSINYDVIAVDLPGFGASSKDQQKNYSALSQVERLVQFIDELGLKSVNIAGNSMGGSIAGEFAAKHSSRVRSLWLLDAAGIRGAEPSEFDLHMSNGGENIMIPASVQEFDMLMEWLYNYPPAIPEQAKAAIVADIARNAKFAEKTHQDLVADWPDLAETLRDFDKPTLITWGEQDRFTHPSGAKLLQDVIPNAQLEMIQECGHIPMLERPERTANAFLVFAQASQANANQ